MADYGLDAAAEAFVKAYAPIDSGSSFEGEWTGTIAWAGSRGNKSEAVTWRAVSVPAVIEGLVDYFAKRMGCTREAVVASLVADIKSGNMPEFGKGVGWGKEIREAFADQVRQEREGRTTFARLSITASQ